MAAKLPATGTADARPKATGLSMVEFADDPPEATTASRAVAPQVVVPNRRLARGGFGEAFLTWRCSDCGELGMLDALPARCVCGASRERLYYETED